MSTTTKARELLLGQIEQRLAILEAYEAADERRRELAAQLESATADAVSKWEALSKAGWSDRELRALGLSAPATAGSKPKRTRRKATDAAASEDAPVSVPSKAMDQE